MGILTGMKHPIALKYGISIQLVINESSTWICQMGQTIIGKVLLFLTMNDKYSEKMSQ